MTDPLDPVERERERGEIARVRRSLLIIFGVGGLATVLAVIYVMRHLPEGHLKPEGEPAPVPGFQGNGTGR